ncbi:enoyl-CoA hydratase/isomerase family protein [Chloroflexota bacterium]
MAIDYQKEGRIAIFTLDRQAAFNAIDMATFREFCACMADFRDDPETWVGIVTGAGEKAFSAGADIKDMLSFLKEHRDDPEALPPSIMRGLEVWKPLIAAINGVALGGGLEIALACDIRIAAENAHLGAPEVTLGLIPGWGGTQRLPRLLGEARAAELLLTGRPIDAQEAYRIGLVNKVVPPDQLMSTAREWAEVICRAGPLAVRGAKQAMLRGSSMSLDEGLKLENSLINYLFGTEDFIEGTTAFAEKRKPAYKAK